MGQHPWSQAAPPDREFAAAYRSRPKWVVSRSLKSAGPNAKVEKVWVGAYMGDNQKQVEKYFGTMLPTLQTAALPPSRSEKQN